MRECLSYPSKGTFSRVLGLSNRPLSREAANLPDDPRLEIHTGIDLLDKDQTRQTLETIPAINEVTHVYFIGRWQLHTVAYTGQGRTAEELVRLNSAIIDHALLALKKLCPKMKFFTLQTGGKVSILVLMRKLILTSKGLRHSRSTMATCTLERRSSPSPGALCLENLLLCSL